MLLKQPFIDESWREQITRKKTITIRTPFYFFTFWKLGKLSGFFIFDRMAAILEVDFWMVWISNGRISYVWDHSYNYGPDHLKSRPFRMVASLNWCVCKHNFSLYIKWSILKMSGFQMVGTTTPFQNRTKWTIQNSNRSSFRIPTVLDILSPVLLFRCFQMPTLSLKTLMIIFSVETICEWE